VVPQGVRTGDAPGEQLMQGNTEGLV